MEQTLLLNATYEPLKVVHWQKAITLLYQGKVEVISEHDREIRAVSFRIKLPSVIRLLRYTKIKRRFGCPIGCHPQTAPMISDPEFFRSFGFELEIEPVKPDFFIEETPAEKFLGLEMQVLDVPGHCPGSLCFFSRKDQLLIGGDVLFAGGVGRWYLPGGDADLLFDGIRKKLFPLGDNVTVLPGHGPDAGRLRAVLRPGPCADALLGARPQPVGLPDVAGLDRTEPAPSAPHLPGGSRSAVGPAEC